MLEHRLQDLAQRARIGETEVIHRIRVDMKRLRALLRLLRPHMNSKINRQLQTQCQAIAARLAPARDEQVARETLSQLLGATRNEAGERLERALQLQNANEAFLPDWREAETVLQQLGAGFSTTRLPPLKRGDLRRGLDASFRRGRQDWREVKQNGSIEALHDWRKQVKRLYYQQLMLNQALNRTTRRSGKLKQLGEKLGQLHDLDMLTLRLQTQRRHCWQEDLSWLQSHVRAQRALLLDAALHLGRKLYARCHWA